MKRKGHFYCSTAPPHPTKLEQAGCGPGLAGGPSDVVSAGLCREGAARLKGCHSDTDRDTGRHNPETRRQDTQAPKSLGGTVPRAGRKITLGLIITVVILLTLFVTRCTPYIAPLTLSHLIFKASRRNWYSPLKDKLSLEMLTK